MKKEPQKTFETAEKRDSFILEQRDAYGKTYAEIGEMLGISKQRTQQIYRRAKEEFLGIPRVKKPAGRPKNYDGMWNRRTQKYKPVLSPAEKQKRLLDIKNSLEAGQNPEIIGARWGVSGRFVLRTYEKMKEKGIETFYE